MRKLFRTIKYLVIGDVHLGSERTKTVFIIKNLDEFFDNYRDDGRFANIDTIYIAGDLFDKSLSLTSDDAYEILLWMGRLMRFCYRRKIALRVLRGTPSHDREQSKLSEVMYHFMVKSDQDFDFKYVDTLFIEKNEKLGLNILYVPDEWNSNNDTTLQQVKELMRSEGLNQLDIAVMHGSFKYQLPFAPPSVPMHDESAYLALVKYNISIGHVHEFSVFDRIVAEGSFDRLNHGSEDPKGGVLFTIDENGSRYEFIENKTAKVYKTIELKNKDLEKSLAQISKGTLKLPMDSYVRIKTTKDHPVYQAFSEVQAKFPSFNFTKLTKEDERDNYELIASTVSLDNGYVPIHIHRDNIVNLVTETIMSKHVLTERQKLLLNRTLEQTNAQ